MQTIKTAIVVVLLLAVCYGAIVALNAPDPKLPPELQQWADGSLDVDLTRNATELVALDPPRLPKPSDPRTTPSSVLSHSVRESSTPQPDPLLVPPDFPKFDVSAQPPKSNVPAELVSLPVPRLTEIQGPDGLAVKMPSANGQTNKADSSPMSSNSLVSHPANSPLATPVISVPASPASLAETKPVAPSSKIETKLPTRPFKEGREQALKMAAEGKLKDALSSLSLYYRSIELTREEFLDLTDLLDALSREVIYSKQHLLEPAYKAVAGDTLQSVALKHNISVELLSRINGVGDSNVVLPGTEFKVVRGPFYAEIDLTRGELTIFVGDLYAGRFPVSTGQDPVPREGNFEIVDKRRDRTYYGAGNNVIPAEDPRNPYGGYWMNLGQDMCIHGTPEMATSELSKAGCISLAPIDASDAFGILAQGCKVRIHR